MIYKLNMFRTRAFQTKTTVKPMTVVFELIIKLIDLVGFWQLDPYMRLVFSE